MKIWIFHISNLDYMFCIWIKTNFESYSMNFFSSFSLIVELDQFGVKRKKKYNDT